MKKNIVIAILLLCNGLILYLVFSKVYLSLKPDFSSTAIELAKHARTLGDKTINNHAYILNRIKTFTGVLNIEGWKPKKINDDLFLVQYEYDKPILHWWFDTRYIFEVNVKQELVRNVIGDYELEELYGIIDEKEKLYKIAYKLLNDISSRFYKEGRSAWGEILVLLGLSELYRRYIDIIQYNAAKQLEFEYDPIFNGVRKPIIKALIKRFSDTSEAYYMPERFKKEYGENIFEYHKRLIKILNITLQNAPD